MKLKNNKGSSFIIVIIALALFTIFIGIISMQINNQIKSNKNTLENISSKYAAEAGIENAALNIINQIESNINESQSSTRNITGYKSQGDEFASVKNKLKEVYYKLEKLNKIYNISTFDETLSDLYILLSTKYDTVNDLKNDIDNIKWDIIQKQASEKNDIVKQNSKSLIYESLDDINNAIMILLSSDKIHDNDGHGAFDIKITGNEWYSKVDSDEVDRLFIGNSNEEPSYKLATIIEYSNTALIPGISKLENNISCSDWNLRPELLKNKLIEIASDLQTEIRNSQIKINNQFWNLKNLSTPNLNDKNINTIKDELCDSIDDNLIEGVYLDESKIYKVYMEEFNKYEEVTLDNLKILKEISMKFDIMKSNLIELKCKLGHNYIDTSGEVTLPDIEGNISKELYIELDGFTGYMSNEYTYNVEKIEKTLIPIDYNSSNVSSVDDIELEIISTGEVQDKKYKRIAIVVFTTTKLNDGFVANYRIKSYKDN